MCCFYTGIAQIALDPWTKSAPSHSGKRLHPPPRRAMPVWKQHILKGTSLSEVIMVIDDNGENYVSVGVNGNDGGGDVMVDGVGVFYKGDNDNKGGDN